MKRNRTIAIFCSLWALVAMSSLCTMGVIGHVCDCGEATECHHESECPSDPCNTLTAVSYSHHSHHLKLPALVVTLFVGCIQTEPLQFMQEPGGHSDHRVHYQDLQFFSSDVPLLI